MRIAVGLFGIHYAENLNHWAKWITTVDYRATLQNNRDRLYSCWPDSKIDYFSATYRSPLSPMLKKDYNLRRIRYHDLDPSFPKGAEMFTRRNQIFKRTLELMLDPKYSDDYDYALITRYDMFMKTRICGLKFDYDKVNVFYKAKWGSNDNLCDDNFYFMKFNYLPTFYNEVAALDETISSHSWNLYLTNLHFMVPGAYYSHESFVYHIHRAKFKDLRPEFNN